MNVLTPDNLLAYSAQIAFVTVLAGAMPLLLGVRSPAARHAYWRSVLALCLLLPWLQTPQRVTGGADAGSVQVFTSVASTAPPDVAGGGVESTSTVIVLLAAGCLARLIWLVVGWWRLGRLRHEGFPVEEDEAVSLPGSSGRSVEIRYLSEVTQPVMFGLLRPTVLLPVTLRDEPEEIRRAVLAHEIGHVQRRDWCWVVAEELVRAALWFHPAIWWLIARLRAAREELVDRLAVSMTGEVQAYQRALLRFADEPSLTPAAAFGQSRHLFHRIVHISREDVMSSKRLFATCVVLVVVIAAGGWYAARAFPLTEVAGAQLQAEPGPLERAAKAADADTPAPRKLRDVTPLYPADPVARQMSVRVTIRATVDETGRVVETRFTGLDLATGRLRFASQGGDVARQLEMFYARGSLEAGPGKPPVSATILEPVVQAFVESALAAVNQWEYEPPTTPIAFDVTVHFAGASQVSSAPTPSADSPLSAGAIRVGGHIKAPAKLRDVRPVYPQEAQDARVQGVVILEIRIDGEGRVAQGRILRSVPGLDEAALDAVRQWEFQPTLLNGVPTPVVMVVTVQFTLG